MMNSSSEKLITLDFEVFGKVQGVFFRKYTEGEANRLGIRGWCMNTPHSTVKGVIEGPPEKISVMKNWLKNEGSPQSRIDKVIFSTEKSLFKYTYNGFKIKR